MDGYALVQQVTLNIYTPATEMVEGERVPYSPQELEDIREEFRSELKTIDIGNWTEQALQSTLTDRYLRYKPVVQASG